MQDFEGLPKPIQNYINGKIAQFMDSYIRRKRVWTPTQMLEDFAEKLEEEENVEWSEWSDPELRYICEFGNEWMLTQTGGEFVLGRMTKKFLKDQAVAEKKGTVVDRVQLGQSWDSNRFYQIAFGLKEHNYIRFDEFKNIPYVPWTIEHVNSELSKTHTTDLRAVLETLSTSYLEKKFTKFWLENYYGNKNNPAILPEVCGFRERFYYYEYDDEVYTSYEALPQAAKLTTNFKSVNFRFDFLLVSAKKQKAIFLELDGFNFHKSKKKQMIDSIKRNTAAKFEATVLVFTSNRIMNHLESCFDDLRGLLEA